MAAGGIAAAGGRHAGVHRASDRAGSGEPAAYAAPAFLLLTAVIALAPLPFASNRPWAWSLMSLVIGAALVLWSFGALARPAAGVTWRQHGIASAAFLALCLWLAFQTVAVAPASWHDPLWRMAGAALGAEPAGAISADPAASRDGLMRLVCYAGVFWLAAQYGRTAANARAMLWVTAAASSLYAAYGIAVFASGNDHILWYAKWAYRGDLTGPFINRNNFADYAGLGLLAGLALLIVSTRRGTRGGIRHFLETVPARSYGLALACVTLATALALSHSRGGLISAILGVTVLLGTFAASRRGRARGPIAAAAVILLALLAVFDASGDGTARRLVDLAGDGTGRDQVHGLALRAMADAPWTGRGLATFPGLYYRYRDGAIPWSSPPYDKAHGAWLEFALEAGLVGSAAMALILGAIAVTLARGVLRRRRDAVFPCLGLAAGALIGAHSALDFGVQIPAVAITFCALLGTAFAQSWTTAPQPGPGIR